MLGAAVLSLNGQSYNFGRNKVNYTVKNWKMLESESFDIYHYQGGEELAQFALMVAESSMTRLQNVFDYKLKNRVPVMIYNSHKDFEETNVTIEILDEFVGGFTESLKNRVVLPFDGSFSDFRHVINHELTHAMQFDFLYGKGGAGIIVSSMTYDIPLWFIEGSAEYFSRLWDSETDMYMRDAVFNDEFVDLEILGYYSGGYIIYKEGQAVHKYIADTYGEKKIVEIYRDIKKTRSFYKSIINVLGIDIDELDRDFKLYLQKRYAYLYSTADFNLKSSKPLLGDFLKTSPYNIAPAMSPDGNYLAFISEKYGFFDIYMLKTGEPQKKWKITPRTLVRNYESFHLRQGKLNWSHDSRWLLFSVRNKANERIIIYDVERRRKVLTRDIKADGLFSPDINPDKNLIVCTVMREGQTNIVLYNIENDSERTLTSDIYDDINPAFLNNDKIVFSSTRPHNDGEWDYEQYRLFIMDIKTGNISLLSDNVKAPITDFSIVNDSMIVFQCIETGIPNVFKLNINTKDVVQLSDVATGVFDPTMSENGNIMAVRLFKGMQMDIRMMTNPLNSMMQVNRENALIDYEKIFYPYSGPGEKKGIEPPFRVSFDWLAGAFSYSPGYGFIGLLNAAVSDIMGNNRLYIDMQKLSTTGNGYITVQYWNLRDRIDYAIMYLNMQTEYLLSYYNAFNYNSQVHVYNGVGGLISYPLDRYNRFDFELDIYDYKIYNRNTSFNTSTTVDLYNYTSSTAAVSFVHDNTVWGYYGPVNGESARLDFGSTFLGPGFTNNGSIDFITPSYRFSYVNADIRKYFVLTARSQAALKLAGISYFGPEYYAANLGGTGTLRGYPYGIYYASNVYYLNAELRFPLIDHLSFGLPGFSLGNIRGVLFTDMGFAKDDMGDLRLFTDQYVLDDLKMGYGAGIRMDIWIAILKLDVAKHTDMQSVSEDYYWHLDFGAEF